MNSVGILGVDFQIDGIDIGEGLNSNLALPSITGLEASAPEIAEDPEWQYRWRNHCHHVAAAV